MIKSRADFNGLRMRSVYIGLLNAVVWIGGYSLSFQQANNKNICTGWDCLGVLLLGFLITVLVAFVFSIFLFKRFTRLSVSRSLIAALITQVPLVAGFVEAVNSRSGFSLGITLVVASTAFSVLAYLLMDNAIDFRKLSRNTAFALAIILISVFAYTAASRLSDERDGRAEARKNIDQSVAGVSASGFTVYLPTNVPKSLNEVTSSYSPKYSSDDQDYFTTIYSTKGNEPSDPSPITISSFKVTSASSLPDHCLFSTPIPLDSGDSSPCKSVGQMPDGSNIYTAATNDTTAEIYFVQIGETITTLEIDTFRESDPSTDEIIQIIRSYKPQSRAQLLKLNY